MTTLVLEHLQHADSASPDITIDSNGRVGIGNTSPTYKFEVSGTGDTVQYIANANPSGSQGRTLLIRDNYASASQDSKISFAATSSPGNDVYLGKRTTSNAGYFHLTNSGGTEHMTVNMTTGNVGIGTSSPNYTLDIASSGTLLNMNSTNSNGIGTVYRNSGTAIGYVGSSKYIHSGTIGDFAIGTASSNNLTFGINSSEKMRINSSGNVGIGSSNPLAMLDIEGDTTTYDGMAKIYLTDSNGNSNSRNWSIGNGGSAFGNLTFAVSAAKDGVAGDGSSLNAMVIDSAGNVGIGTNNPDQKFHVEGSAQNFKVESTGLIIGTPKPSTAQGISYGTQVDYTSNDLSPAISGSSNGWYTLVAGLDDGSYTFHLKTGAHSSIIFSVGTGYAASAQENLQILQFTDNPNSTYLNIKGVRVTNGGGVEVYLYAGNPIDFSMSVHAVGNGNFGTAIPFVATLSKQTGSPTVRDSAYPLFNKTSRFNIMTAQNQPGFFARGAGSWSNPGNADLVFSDLSSSATYNDGGHYNNSNGRFTVPVTGKYIIGANIYHRNDSGYDDDTNHQYWYFRKNGSSLSNTNNVIMGYQNNGDADATFPMSVVVKLNAGDYITVYNSNASGDGSYYMGGCEFWGTLLG
jgi:hypothetical protein